jgi:hypothetical protein
MWKQGVVLLHRRDEGIAERQAYLGEPEDDHARDQIIPTELRQGKFGKAQAKGEAAEFLHDRRFRTGMRVPRSPKAPASSRRLYSLPPIFMDHTSPNAMYILQWRLTTTSRLTSGMCILLQWNIFGTC